MKTAEQQATEAEVAAKELKERTVELTLNEKQVKIIENLKTEQQALQEKAQQLQSKEADLITFALGFSGIEQEEIEGISMRDGKIIITKKKKELAPVPVSPNGDGGEEEKDTKELVEVNHK